MEADGKFSQDLVCAWNGWGQQFYMTICSNKTINAGSTLHSFFLPRTLPNAQTAKHKMPTILLTSQHRLVGIEYSHKSISEKNCNINCEINMKRKYFIMWFPEHKVTVTVNYLTWKTANTFQGQKPSDSLNSVLLFLLFPPPNSARLQTPKGQGSIHPLILLHLAHG